MTITTLLCKYFDADEKGYVTLGNIVSLIISVAYPIIFVVSTTFITGCAYLYGAWLIYNGALTSDELLPPVDVLCSVLFGVASAMVAVVIVAYIAFKLASIRVVTCERKDGAETL